jgi:hypothetical protein
MDDGSPPVALATGDVVFPHGVGHTLADNPATPAIELGDYVADLAPGGKAALPMGEDGRATTLLCGSYFFGPDGANRSCAACRACSTSPQATARIHN